MMYALFANTGIKMTIILMVIACLLPYLCASLAKYVGGFNMKDNQAPREFLANTQGAAARLNHAQTNSFESLPIFLASVLVAIYAFVPASIINMLATGFILFRICFIISYAANLAILRSVTWMLSLICCIMLFILAYQMGV